MPTGQRLSAASQQHFATPGGLPRLGRLGRLAPLAGLVASLAVSLGACASNPASGDFAGPPARPPVDLGARPLAPPAPAAVPLQNYARAPAALAFEGLRVCHSDVSNAGAVGPSGEALDWRPFIPTRAGDLLRNPTQGACLSSGFGWRGAATGGGRSHGGLDLANPNGGFVYAAGAGRVLQAGPRGDYGLSVELDHGAGVRTLYGHLAEINPDVGPGAWAPAGAAIGFMGRTGNATGVHLHYEVLIDGLKVDPLVYGAPPAAPIDPAPYPQPDAEPDSEPNLDDLLAAQAPVADDAGAGRG